MKIRLLLATLLCALAAAPGIQAQEPKAAPAGEKEPKTALEEQMEKMNVAFRKLRGGAVADATKNEASLAAVADIKSAATAALKLEPKTKAEKPAADQAKYVSDYQAKMKEFIGELDKLTAALKAGNNEEAAKLYAAIGDLQKADHKEFRKPPAKKN
jgi:soluble cytochrome b562